MGVPAGGLGRPDAPQRCRPVRTGRSARRRAFVSGVVDARKEASPVGRGIDWAEQFHLVAVGRGENGVLEVTRVQHLRCI